MHDLGVYAKLVDQIRLEFPGFRIVQKEASSLMKACNFILLALSCGFADGFMSRFVTTYNGVIYVPEGWSDHDPLLKAASLRHERVHLQQQARMGLFLFTLVYLFWIFPIGLALGRCKLEQEAYAESLRANVEYFGESVLVDPEFRAKAIRHFTTIQYFWMWPFRGSIEAWYDSLVLKVRQEISSSPT